MTWFCVVLCLWFTETLPFYMPKLKYYPNSGNTGYPSFVTPFINRGNITEGQKNCTVSPMLGGLESYAGYFTVRQTLTYKSHLFFWFFPVELKYFFPLPCVMWLQGGTGLASVLSVFEGNGPYYLAPDGGIRLRRNRMTRRCSVLYIDAPIGSGYSIVGNEVGYSSHKGQTVDILFNALLQFFKLFPKAAKGQFFICAESYASNLVPQLAQKIHWHNAPIKAKRDKIKLNGIALGSVFFDPINMTTNYSSVLYENGFIDFQAKTEFQHYENKILEHAKGNQFEKAFHCFDEMILGLVTPYRTLFRNATGFIRSFNSRFPNIRSDLKYHNAVARYTQSDYFRRAVHVGNFTFNTDYIEITKYMLADIMTPIKLHLEHTIKNRFRVLLYHGQLDILVPYNSVVNYLKQLKWRNSERYTTNRRRWLLSRKKIVGFFKEAGNLTELLILDTGHLLSHDQPRIVTEVLFRFINKTLY